MYSVACWLRLPFSSACRAGWLLGPVLRIPPTATCIRFAKCPPPASLYARPQPFAGQARAAHSFLCSHMPLSISLLFPALFFLVFFFFRSFAHTSSSFCRRRWCSAHCAEQLSDDEDDGFEAPIEDYFPPEQPEVDPATQDVTDVMEAMAISLSSSQSIAARAAAEAAIGGGPATMAAPTPNSPIDMPSAESGELARPPPKVGSSDFDILKVIGQGGYGKVRPQNTFFFPACLSLSAFLWLYFWRGGELVCCSGGFRTRSKLACACARVHLRALSVLGGAHAAAATAALESTIRYNVHSTTTCAMHVDTFHCVAGDRWPVSIIIQSEVAVLEFSGSVLLNRPAATRTLADNVVSVYLLQARLALPVSLLCFQ